MIELYIILAVISLLLVLVAVVLMTMAVRRFVKGELRSFLTWMLIGFWLMAIPYSLFIIREVYVISGEQSSLVSLIIYACMCVVALCVLRASFILDKFSKVFGFAE
ncbi:Uncharacterised protein [Candidatus Bilamarchaeum dharawalense]|uniref:Uncharacterized protein n=1 Tax=Candidatus Bilamarchaeum dharawalense TaxID=2885759 RepID=A0A5E4LP07_9ARCH|nr:Uncharacterised protein [Candidatus Bilamarchaeum dharawalense]